LKESLKLLEVQSSGIDPDKKSVAQKSNAKKKEDK